MKRFVILTVALMTAGCARFGGKGFKEPLVTFKDAKVTGLGLTGGAVDIVLDVYNPNGFRLEGTRLTYKVLVDSVTFGTGTYDTRFQVEKGETSTIHLPLQFSYAGVGVAGKQLLNMGQVRYRVLGDVTVATPLGNFTRPYDQTGTFSTASGVGR